MASGEEETLYCICREPYDGERFMIECDKCTDWFHGSCVDIKEHQAADIETYHCPDCQIKHGPLVLKKRRNYHRHDYSDADESYNKKVQAGTVRFISELKGRKFPPPEGIMVYLTDGYELDMEFLDETEFKCPVIVFNREGLDLKVPPSSFTIQDVENHIGSMREIDVINVAKQEDGKMLMREWTEYYTSSVRDKVLNVISLEFSKTRLGNLVEPPRIVRELSWVNNYWPKSVPEYETEYERPSVQKYCLMSVKDSYTDFHIDFGGTSVWYHVLKGEKVFYLIEPTSANLQLYETWLSSANQSEVFFGDQVDICYKCVVKQGQTLFIPTGWIHAVLTPIDSLVFGGNFLHNYNMPLQIQVYDIEKRTGAAKKYLFPNYETLHWYAAQHICKTLQGYTRFKKEPPLYLTSGAKALSIALKEWTHKRDYIKRDNIPDSIQYGKLLKDLEREVRLITKPKDRRKKKPGNEKQAEIQPKLEIKSDKDESSQSDIDIEVKSEDEKPKVGEGVCTVGDILRNITKASTYSTLNVPKTPPKSPRGFDVKSPKSEQKSPKTHERSPRTSEKSPRSAGEKSPITAGRLSGSSSPRGSLASPHHTDQRLTFRLPKSTAIAGPVSKSLSQSSDISVYDFDEEEAKANASERSGTESDLGSPLGSPSVSRPRQKSESSLAGGDLFGPPRKITLKLGASAASESRHFMSGRGDAKRSISTSQEEASDSDSDSETEQHLVVDETPKKRRKMSTAEAVTGQASRHSELKLKFSVNRSDIQEPSFDTSQDSSYNSTSDVDVVGESCSPLKPASSSTSPAGSGFRSTYQYQSSTPIEKTDSSQAPLPPSRQSSTMRDAVQAMLNMSQLKTVSSTLQKTSTSSPFILDKEKSKATLRLQRESKARSLLQDEEIGERLSTAYKDDEYIYPTLAESDHEDDAAFKQRSKQDRDDAWSPRGRVTSGMPKKERQPRFGARKESLECQLEDAAAKLANKPVPKRQYVKKKPRPDSSPFSGSLFDPIPSTSSSSYDYDPSSPAPLFMDYASTSTSSQQRSQHTSHSHSSSSTPSSSMQHKQAAIRKPASKKGSTAKQRLGKILKLNKMGLF